MWWAECSSKTATFCFSFEFYSFLQIRALPKNARFTLFESAFGNDLNFFVLALFSYLF